MKKEMEKEKNMIIMTKKIFEGEYLNRKKNGKGKEYDNNGKIIFDGEYLKGEKHGKGKEYYNHGNVLFEGEYINGKRWNGIGYYTSNIKAYELKGGEGLVKEYDNQCRLIFEGKYLNGEKWDGIYYLYYSNGKFRSRLKFLNGQSKNIY